MSIEYVKKIASKYSDDYLPVNKLALKNLLEEAIKEGLHTEALKILSILLQLDSKTSATEWRLFTSLRDYDTNKLEKVTA